MGYKYKDIDGLITYIITKYKCLNLKTIYEILNDANTYNMLLIDLIDLNQGLSRLQSDNLLKISGD